MNNLDFFHSSDKYNTKTRSGNIKWQSPSNLAIVKYWGKYDQQLPRNPSISITLSESITKTSVNYIFEQNIKSLKLKFLFEGEKNDAFQQRILLFLKSLVPYFPFLQHAHLTIDSKNSFPHSSGIASSASSMSALALCLCDIEQEILSNNYASDETRFFQKASFISRLGSGSASRSIFPSFSLWGKSSCHQNSSDLYAIGLNNYHKIYSGLRNDIIIVSKSEKSVSSSAGHKLMESNPYAGTRFEQANQRIVELSEHLLSGDFLAFGSLLESEALTLHALMMASNPSYMLMAPNTIKVINNLKTFRKETNIPVFFSLDAGPNVHVISLEQDRNQVKLLLEELKPYTVNGQIIIDRIGNGPSRIN